MRPDERLAALTRGCVECHTLEDLRRKLASGRPLRVKLGVDPTTAELHLGHTVVLNRLRAFQDQGHAAVLIIGDFTARVGDPSGRDATRPTLSQAEIAANAATYREQAFKILDPKRTELRFNSEWLDPFVREGLLGTLGRTTVSQLLERQDFTDRAQKGLPITLLEILYPVFQGYDSVAVGADVELGGSDQLFNLLMGRRMQADFGQEPQVAMTLPLLVGLDGARKMSKTYGNHVALTDGPRDMFGKLMRITDGMMGSYYELLTQEDMASVKALHPMEAKKALAEGVVARFHGEAAAKTEREFFEKTFSKRELPTNVPTLEAPRDLWASSKPSQFLAKLEIVSSRKEAQRLIEQNAVESDGVTLHLDSTTATAFGIESPLSGPVERTVKIGKHKFYKVRFLP